MHEMTMGIALSVKGNKNIPEKRSIMKTSGPEEIYTFVEFFTLVKSHNSLILQRKILSTIIAEITCYSKEILIDLLNEYDNNCDKLNINYVCACVNDTSLLIKQFDYYEKNFINVIKI